MQLEKRGHIEPLLQKLGVFDLIALDEAPIGCGGDQFLLEPCNAVNDGPKPFVRVFDTKEVLKVDAR